MFDEQKRGEQHLAPELVAIERQLLSLTPALPKIDRDRLMFEAGRAAEVAERNAGAAAREPSPNPSLQGRGIGVAATQRVAGERRWFWPVATALMTAASLLLATMLVSKNQSQFVTQQASAPSNQVELQDGSAREASIPSVEFVSHRPSIKPDLNNGYLGIRYVAVMAGVGALPADFQPGADERTVPTSSSPSKPATVRNLMNELIPAAHKATPSRS